MKNFASNIRKSNDSQASSFTSAFAQQSEPQVIKILDELQAFIPPLKKDEYKQLEENILAEGVRDPLVVWENGNELILIDGHNRYSIIQNHNIEAYKVERKQFDNLESVKDWMIRLQLGRRNLTIEQTKYLRGLQFNREKKKATDTLRQGDKSPLAQNEPTGNTADILAQQHKVSRETIKRDAQFAKGVDAIGEQAPEVKRQILSGDLKVKKSDVQAVATGKKAPEELLASLQTSADQTVSALGEAQAHRIKMPVKAEFLSQDLSEKEVQRVNTIHEKFEHQITQLLKLGFDKTQIRWMLSQTVKNIQK